MAATTGLRALLDPLQAGVEGLRPRERLLPGGQRLEQIDVRPRDKGVACADEQHRDRGRVVGSSGDRVFDAFEHAGPEGVHGRVVDRDDRDLVPYLVSDHVSLRGLVGGLEVGVMSLKKFRQVGVGRKIACELTRDDHGYREILARAPAFPRARTGPPSR